MNTLHVETPDFELTLRVRLPNEVTKQDIDRAMKYLELAREDAPEREDPYQHLERA